MSFKTSKTKREYRCRYRGYDLVIPVGSVVSNRTACGADDSYRFLQDTNELARQVTGFPTSTLQHDLTYYGLNIPADYCHPYESN